jgi:hypothetical protein
VGILGGNTDVAHGRFCKLPYRDGNSPLYTHSHLYRDGKTFADSYVDTYIHSAANASTHALPDHGPADRFAYNPDGDATQRVLLRTLDRRGLDSPDTHGISRR